MTAKALASKLNERNNLLNGTKKVTVGGGGGGQSTAFAPSNGTANDIPVPPLISIQTTSSTAAANRFKDATDIQCRDAATTQKHKFVPSKHVNAQSSANFKPFTEAKQHKCSTSSKQSNGTNSTHHTKAAKVKCLDIFLLIFLRKIENEMPSDDSIKFTFIIMTLYCLP